MEMCNTTILLFYIKKENNFSDISFNYCYDCIKYPEYDNEYEKNLEINWGNILWVFLHTITFRINDNLFEEFKFELLSKLKYFLKILPCDICLSHTNEYFEKNPIIVNKKMDLILILYNFHNNVNSENNKPFFSYTDFCEKYENINIFNVFNNFMYILKLFNITNHEKYEIQNWLSSNVEYFTHI